MLRESSRQASDGLQPGYFIDAACLNSCSLSPCHPSLSSVVQGQQIRVGLCHVAQLCTGWVGGGVMFYSALSPGCR